VYFEFCRPAKNVLPRLHLQRFKNLDLLGGGEDLGVDGLGQGHEDPLFADRVAAHADQGLGKAELKRTRGKHGVNVMILKNCQKIAKKLPKKWRF
jgi:hypothetical protein